MRYKAAIPATFLAVLFTAACDSAESPAGPDRSASAVIGAIPKELGQNPVVNQGQSQAPNQDDEFARAARAEVPGFAGYYLDANGTPVVRLVNQAQRAAAQRYLAPQLAKAGRGHNARAAKQAVFVPATYDFAQLHEWSERLVPVLQHQGVYLIDADEVGNRVLVGVGDESAAAAVRARAALLGIPQGALALQMQAAPRSRATVRDRFTTVVGGIQIAFGNFLCTQGFNAKRVSTGANIFVTNSHCTTTQYVSDGVAIYQNTVAAGNQVGNEVADRGMWACAGAGTSCRQADAVFISHNGTRTIGQGGIIRTNWNTGAAGGITTIGEFDIIGRYTGSLPVGSYLDKTGRTSGSTYGVVTNSCVTIGVLRCQDISKVWSEGGDSGSPVYVYIGGAGALENDVQIHGVMWGGPGSDFTTTYSSRLSGIEADLGALTNLCRPGYGC
ncbi:MAG TPA: hypothetical protein VFE05_13605 [Longimicrobiaceae bacterium]|jgi:hypothetical protein|nr:hypothetical protein [Longimicrobiaceae bacterium]